MNRIRTSAIDTAVDGSLSDFIDGTSSLACKFHVRKHPILINLYTSKFPEGYL